ncbi:MAG: glycerophosphoryl diester phosphodiesterase [Patescibacteria group bacterium]|nr:glycerophosphodiester phosphodiesterase [Candidatus Saccharibacteria bacterium]MDQ5963008.1 glycerophosphoryl diester phosphodiesterase [Patescibacteria group bacterium]
MKIIGHRGAAGLAPENTIAAFEVALRLGVDAIECDVHETRDGKLVLFHDHYFEVASKNGDKRQVYIHKHSLSELQKLKPNIATFEQALMTVDGACELLVELKKNVPYLQVAKLVDQYNRGLTTDKTAKIISFEFATLKAVHRDFPHIYLVVNEKWSSIRAILRAKYLHTNRIQMDQKWLWRGVVKHVHKKGIALAPYTVNDPARIRSWEPYLYGVVTDRPDLFITSRDTL